MDQTETIEFDSMFKIEMCHTWLFYRLATIEWRLSSEWTGNEDYQVNGLDCTRSSCNILICGTVMSEWKWMKMEFTVWIWFVCIEWESTNLNEMGLWTVECSMSWEWKRIAQYF